MDKDVVLPDFVPPPMSSALEAELGSLAPTQPRRPLRQLVTLLGVSVIYGAIVLAIVSARRDWASLPTAWVIGVALAWTCGFVVPTYLALVPRPGSVLPRWNLAAFSAVVTAVTFVVLGLLLHPSGIGSVEYGTERFLHGHRCLELGLATAIVPVVLGAIYLRGTLPVGSRWIAAAIGAGGGGLGGLVLHLHCHVTDALHIGFVHGGVVVVSALVAAALVPRAADLR